MDRSSPALLDRIVAALAASGAPRSSSDLAHAFLGVGIVDEALAEQLLGPSLGADPRVERTEHGWQLATRPGALGQSPALGAPFAAIVAPAQVPVFARVDTGQGEPVLAVACAGAAEIDRAELVSGQRLPRPVIDLGLVARRLRGFRGRCEPVPLAEALGVPHVEGPDAQDAAAVVAAVWEHLVDELALEAVDDLDALERLLDDRLEAAPFATKAFGPEEIVGLGEAPGTYVFRDRAGGVLYVGQSINLRTRVRSYFVGTPRDEKDRAVRQQSFRLEVDEVDTGLDALVREDHLIRRLRPRLNRRRDVQRTPDEDGVLAVPAPAKPGRWVLYAVSGGTLRLRVAASPGPRRVAHAAERAAATLFTSGRAGADRRREAALLATWRRTHPGAVFLRPGIDGNAAAIAAALRRAMSEER
jgi:hypothetical protein